MSDDLVRPPSRELKRILDAATTFLNAEHAKGEAAVTAMGKYVMEHIFGGDAALALRGADKHPVWQALLAHTRSPAFHLSQSTLNFARRLGAWDHLIHQQAWQRTPPTTKKLLLPLNDEGKLLTGALHAVKMNLDETGIRQYVRAQKQTATAGRKHANRRSQPRPSVTGVSKAAFTLSAFEERAQVDRFVEKARKLPAARRRALREGLEKTSAALRALLAGLDD